MIEEKKHSLYPRMSKAKDHISRRDFLWMTAASTVGLAQGVSTRNLKPLPRGKPSGIPFLARFTDVAAQAGLTFPVVYGGLTHKNYIIETVGCGVAFLDFDNDGFVDIFITYYGQNVLYRNNGNGTFTDVTQQAGLIYEGHTRWGSGCTFFDYDLDGYLDIFKTHFSDDTNVLYRNDGAGNFTDVTVPAGFGVETRYICWGTGFAD